MAKELYAAMAKAFPELEAAIKDKNNPAFKSKYADLGAVIDAIKPALSKHDLFFLQESHEQEGGACVETILCHASGEERSLGRVFVPASKRDAHGYGSALTYARRYALQTAFGIPAEDDDGNAAVKSAPQAVPSAPYVTPERLEAIQDLVAKTQTDIAALCKHYKVQSLKELTDSQYAHAVKTLESRLPQPEAAE